VVLGFSQDGACTDLLENLSVNSLKRDLSNALTFNPPLFSLVNTFNYRESGLEGANLQKKKLIKSPCPLPFKKPERKRKEKNDKTYKKGVWVTWQLVQPNARGK
jgi:hypothetical protein